MIRFGLFVLCISLTACASEPAEAPPSIPAVPQPQPVALADALPETLLGRERRSLEVSRDTALDAGVSQATARYAGLSVTLADFGTPEMASMMGFGPLAASDAEVLGFPSTREAIGDSAVVRVLVGDRTLVEVTADSDAVADSVLAALNLETLRR